MELLLYILRFLYRIRLWLIVCPLVVALVALYKARNLPLIYDVQTTIYTGVVSGYNLNQEDNSQNNQTLMNNAMDNLINIITAPSTLKNVSMRLFTQHMMYGDPNKDNNFITAAHFRDLLARTPAEVKKLIDKSSEKRTLQNLRNYEQPMHDNYIYGLFNWHPYYSLKALRQIKVTRLGNSDMLDISYSADDPGVAYNTLELLNQEFLEQYKELRFGETNSVIKYFEEELKRIAEDLRESEDSLTNYNIDKGVINYDEQTKHIAALFRDYELRYEDVLLAYTSSKALKEKLERDIDNQVAQIKGNTQFLNKLRVISDLTTKVATMESFMIDSLNQAPKNAAELDSYKKQLEKAEADLYSFTNQQGIDRYTKEGVSSFEFVQQWLAETIRFTKADAELKEMINRKNSLDDVYKFFAPVGSTIKRKEREIGFVENSYLSVLQSLNTARLRQKNLQMSSATLKVINPPTFPISAAPTKRAIIVAGAALAALIFVLGFFLLLELLDRTLRDKIRTERITKGKVLGAFPREGKLKYRGYAKACETIATHYLANSLRNYFSERRPRIVNLLSMGHGDGKSRMANELEAYWTELGMRVKVLNWERDFLIESREFMLATQVSDLATIKDADIVLVEYPPLTEVTLPKGLLRDVDINLLVVRANAVWRDADQVLYSRLLTQADRTPVMLYLTEAAREVVENFTGMLPPYTPMRKWLYRFFQLGLTAEDRMKSERVSRSRGRGRGRRRGRPENSAN